LSTVQSIDRAFAVLRALVGGPAGVTEIADRVGLPKSTVSRMLSTLEELGAVEQVNAGGNYRVGFAMIELGAAARPGRSLVATVRPHLAHLARATGEATGFSIPDGVEMLYLDQITPDSELQVRDWTGHRIPMHAVPSGQVVLATEPALLEQLSAQPLQRFTKHTLCDRKRLAARLEQVRLDGFAFAQEEFADDLNSFAAPVRNRAGQVIGSIHVYGPVTRFPGDRDASELGGLIRDAAAKIIVD
jgi:DNA-binding IclR family transcriptional regulator